MNKTNGAAGKEWHFDEVARLPAPGDDGAVATRLLEPGTLIRRGHSTLAVRFTVLEGHRFAVHPVPAGGALLSWGLPFGIALSQISPGTTLVNASTLEELLARRLDLALPSAPNFADRIVPYSVAPEQFHPAPLLAPDPDPRSFMGFDRDGDRGAGTRNYVLLVGTTSAAGGYVTQLARRLQPLAAAIGGTLDGIVPLAHTEGSTPNPLNLAHVLRVLAGCCVHPNVGAVLVAGVEGEPLTNQHLHTYLAEHNYPLGQMPHHFLALSGNWDADLEAGECALRGWVDSVARTPRVALSAAGLRLALQCGGSDAFSGVSGNPLAGWVARQAIRQGGSANLAETAELIGAEAYLLHQTADLETVRRFLEAIVHIKQLAAWHGMTAEQNVTSGNKFRGLYNIALKSIGAAQKRHPEVRLEAVIDYAQPMTQPGLSFMDSPGLDLESIAGQVAAGCNLILFVTGNGSITNFPFVPTVKIVTTSGRYRALADEMDVNAGAYLDGTPMETLGRQTWEQVLRVASGQPTAGEKARHAQVQLWRNWAQADATGLHQDRTTQPPDGRPIPVEPLQPPPVLGLPPWPDPPVGLILPNSLCSAEVARLAAERLERRGLGRDQGLVRWVALAHTEGCGTARGPAGALFERTLIGYLTHPLVRHALLVEHGCEVWLNHRVRTRLEGMGLEPNRFGWASVQSDGGLNRVLDRIEAWFVAQLAAGRPLRPQPAGIAGLRLAVLTDGPLPPAASLALSQLTQWVAGAGGAVVLLASDPLVQTPTFAGSILGSRPPTPTLAYGQPAGNAGLHLMETPTSHWIEGITGLGATGVNVMLVHVGQRPRPGHPMIPLLQVTTLPAVQARFAAELDAPSPDDPFCCSSDWLELTVAAAAGRLQARVLQRGDVAFQLTRGLLGFSI